jgi:hypothetical protein
LDEVEEEVEELDELDSEEVEELDELGADELLLLSLLLLLDELSPLGLLSEVPLLSASDVELFTSVFSPLFSDWATGSLSLSE